MPTTVQAFKWAIRPSLNVQNKHIAWELDIMTNALDCTEWYKSLNTDCKKTGR